MLMRKGLGVVANPDGSYYVPGWCSWLPFSSFNDACAPPTRAQALADQMSNLGPAAKSNPALVESLQREWDRTDETMCADDPAGCAEYNFALDYPAFSSAFGVGAQARGAAEFADRVTALPAWVWPVGVLVGGVAALSILKGVVR